MTKAFHEIKKTVLVQVAQKYLSISFKSPVFSVGKIFRETLYTVT